MKYYCFYIDCGNAITKTTIIMTENYDKIDALQRVLYELGYSKQVVNDIDEFVEWAKPKCSKIQILNLDEQL